MKVIDHCVAVHSCLLRFDLVAKESLERGERYLASCGNFRLLPQGCRCRKWVTLYKAYRWIETGRAEPVYRYRRGRMQPDQFSIWMAQQRQVPRIDLVTKADIERACCTGGNPISAAAAMEQIEEVHRMFMENRAKLIVPYRQPDPFYEGQLLFPFGNEGRTKGGYK